jgi:hypothetical protein
LAQETVPVTAESGPEEDQVRGEEDPLVRLTVLESRVLRCLAYLEWVEYPNLITVEHVRRYLDGTYDGVKV